MAINKIVLGLLVTVSGISIMYANIIDKTDAMVIPLKNNQTVVVQLSNSDPNRLFVENDKINNANCLQGFCGVSYDPSGSVYLTLGEAARYSSGFSIFLSTESGRHFTVIGMPERAVGKTVEFSISGGSSVKAREFEKKTPYQEMLVQIITMMINYRDGEPLTDGWSVVDLPNDQKDKNNKNKQKVEPDQQGLLIQPVQIFSGGIFQGIVYAVKNTANTPANLSTKAFYQRSMVAGALSHKVLKQGEVGYFYGVIQSEQDNP
ncbi:type-F conjugative transfer system secretin TraK [Fastidiosibacter lacustris]|uniref:type-F conjugative transfer system secretin TraK n=1 Tax=Fastidiosibacter lacustris TaxID=2056695 RepID=UPI000E34AE40|nr:type-F conjugative transfer system secretin TraK [Fastidiosibacter lacustris]